MQPILTTLDSPAALPLQKAIAKGGRKVLLWLDDQRDPSSPECKALLPADSFDEVVWVRDFFEMQAWLSRNPLPHTVSFDHDLAQEHYTPECYWDDYEASEAYQMERYPNYSHPTGAHCAIWLFEFLRQRKPSSSLTTRVHSANPVGAAWIDLILMGVHTADYQHLSFILKSYQKAIQQQAPPVQLRTAANPSYSSPHHP